MADRRAALQRAAGASERELRQAWHDFQRALQAAKRRKVQAAVTTIEALLETGITKDTWDHISQWYCKVRGKQPHPNQGGTGPSVNGDVGAL